MKLFTLNFLLLLLTVCSSELILHLNLNIIEIVFKFIVIVLLYKNFVKIRKKISFISFFPSYSLLLRFLFFSICPKKIVCKELYVKNGKESCYFIFVILQFFNTFSIYNAINMWSKTMSIVPCFFL